MAIPRVGFLVILSLLFAPLFRSTHPGRFPTSEIRRFYAAKIRQNVPFCGQVWLYFVDFVALEPVVFFK
jgi:hypothetical protein